MGLPGVFLADFLALSAKTIITITVFEVIGDSKYVGVLEDD